MFTEIFLISLRLMCFAIPIIFFYSLFKPRRFNISTKNHPNGKYSRSKYYLAMLGVWIFLVTLGTVINTIYSVSEEVVPYTSNQDTIDSSYEVNASNKEPIFEHIGIDSSIQVETLPTEVVSVSKILEDDTFNVTLKELDKNLEDLTKKLGLYDEAEGETSSYILNVGEVEDTFVEKFSESVSTIGVLSKSGNIKKITVTKNKTLETGDQIEDLIMVLVTMAVGLDPNLDMDTTRNAFLYLVQSSKYQFEAEGSSIQKASIGNIIYIVRMSEETNTQVTLLPYQ